MSSTPHEPSSREDRVNEAIAAYLQAVERGDAPDRQRFLAEYVDIAPELKSFFDNQAEFCQVAGASARKSAADPDEPTLTFRGRGIPSLKDVIRYFGDYELLGLAQLRGLSSLRWLWLENTAVTDVGLAHLKDLPNLELVRLGNTHVTRTGVDSLMQGHPRLCHVAGGP
jgi:hypothetical protein